MRKLKLSLIANETSRKTTFMKRKKGMMKKLHELTTLCGVQACGVIYSPYLSEPEAWPSKEGAEEVASKFMEMPVRTRTKKMMSQETYLREKIATIKDQVDKLALENRDLQVRQFMFDCLDGKMSEYRYGEKDLTDLKRYINHYIDKVNQRIQSLVQNGESSSFPPLPVGVADVDPPTGADYPIFANTAAISVASGFNDHIQNQTMNMNQTQQERIQYRVPVNSYDIIQYQNMNMNQNQQELVQYQTPTDLYDQIQQGIYNNMIWNQNTNLDLNHNLNMNLDMNSNLHSNQQQPFKGMMVEQHMGYTGGRASFPFMDGNHYNYHQQPIVDLAVTGHIPSFTTSNTDIYAPYIKNNF